MRARSQPRVACLESCVHFAPQLTTLRPQPATSRKPALTTPAHMDLQHPQPCDLHICSQLVVSLSLPGYETLVGTAKAVWQLQP